MLLEQLSSFYFVKLKSKSKLKTWKKLGQDLGLPTREAEEK